MMQLGVTKHVLTRRWAPTCSSWTTAKSATLPSFHSGQLRLMGHNRISFYSGIITLSGDEVGLACREDDLSRNNILCRIILRLQGILSTRYAAT